MRRQKTDGEGEKVERKSLFIIVIMSSMQDNITVLLLYFGQYI